jgi:hypothetical protein
MLVAHTYSCCLSLDNQSMKEGSLFVLSVLFVYEGRLFACLFCLCMKEGYLFVYEGR